MSKNKGRIPYPRLLVRYFIIALFQCVFSMPVWAEHNLNEVPDEGDLDEGARAVLERVKRPDTIKPETWKEILERYKIKMSKNEKVRFYGVVVDQDGLYLEGVGVSGIVRSYDSSYLESIVPGASDQKDQDWTAATDINGRFMVDGISGISLHIRKLEKDGYIAPAYDGEVFLVSEKLYRNLVHKAQEDQPVVFKMWAKDKAQHAADLVQNEIKISGPADGREYRVDLAIGSCVTNTEDIFDLSVRVVSASHSSDAGPKYDWSFTLSTPDGGLIPTEDAHPFEAPKVGYASPVVGEHSSVDKMWSRSEQRRYYLRSRGGALYAMMDVTVYAYRDGISLVRIDSVVNAGGSRNLMNIR